MEWLAASKTGVGVGAGVEQVSRREDMALVGGSVKRSIQIASARRYSGPHDAKIAFPSGV
jgi:hypothetical protein